MAWGKDGEEVRAQAQVELSLVRQPLYRLGQVLRTLQHPEKGPELRDLHRDLTLTLDRIEAVLRR